MPTNSPRNSAENTCPQSIRAYLRRTDGSAFRIVVCGVVEIRLSETGAVTKRRRLLTFSEFSGSLRTISETSLSYGDWKHDSLFIIAIDGPAGSGKSTTAQLVAQALGFRRLDTGAMYRAVTLRALEKGLDFSDCSSLGVLAEETSIEFSPVADTAGVEQVTLDGLDITAAIRTSEVARHVSQVAACAEVRLALVERQREFARTAVEVVAEGRDIGTVVFPQADLKVYLDASLEERARRRSQDMLGAGTITSAREQIEEIRRRDELDTSRENSPLKQAPDAVKIDTTGMTIDQQVQAIVDLARKKMARVG